MGKNSESLDDIIASLSRQEMSRRSALKAIAAGGAGIAASTLFPQIAWGARKTGPGGLPLARPDQPVTLPMNGKPIADGLKPESGTFTLFNYAAYLDKALLKKFGEKYDVDVQLTTFTNMDQAITKLANHDVDADVTEIRPDRLDQAVAGKLLQPLNHSYIPNLKKNVWPQLHSPYYDRESRYTVPYTVYTTGIGWRSDKIKEDIANMANPWSIFWKAQDYKGYTGLIDSSREAIALALLYRGHTSINTEVPKLIQRAEKDLATLVPICNPKLNITQYQTLAKGTSWLHQAWSGDLLTAKFFYLSKSQSAKNLQYWKAPKGKGPVQNDCWAVTASSSKPVLAHLWLNFILDEKNAYTNFTSYTGYQPPIMSINADQLISEGTVPAHLRTTLVEPDDLGPGSIQYQTLTTEGQRMWQRAYARFVSGV